jgi:hypothetical protein
MGLSASLRGLEDQFDKLEAALRALDDALAGLDASLTSFSVELDLLTERMASLPSKGFWLASMAMEVVVVSGVILFDEELKTLIGL